MSIRELGWPALVAMAAALATVGLLFVPDLERFEWILKSWPVQVAGLLALGVSLWRYRRWWELFFAGPLVLPLLLWATLFYQCANGACL